MIRRKKSVKRKPVAIKPKKIAIGPYKKRLWKKFADFIKARDGRVCFSCGAKGLDGSNRQAGHLFSAGKYPAIRWDVENCRVQCARCNIWLKGNYIEYHDRFKAIYPDVYDRLHSMRNDFQQWRLPDLQEVEAQIDRALIVVAKK